MARTVPNASAAQIEGRIGKLVHYELNDKTFVRSAPLRKKPPTAAEKNNQSRFRAAPKFAHSALLDPKLMVRYSAAAAKTGSSAYNVAVSDFMHAPMIGEVDLTGYTGRASQIIRVRVEEKKIAVSAVNLVIADDTRSVLEQGAGSLEDDGLTWSYAAQQDIPLDRSLWIVVTAQDLVSGWVKLLASSR